MKTFIVTDSRGYIDQVQSAEVTLDGVRQSMDGTDHVAYEAPASLAPDEIVALVGNAWVREGRIEVNSISAIRERLATEKSQVLDQEEYAIAQTMLVLESILASRGVLQTMQSQALLASRKRWDAIHTERDALQDQAPPATPILEKIAGRTYALQGMGQCNSTKSS